MPKEAVDAVLGAARRRFSSGQTEPVTGVYTLRDRRRGCAVGAAAMEVDPAFGAPGGPCDALPLCRERYGLTTPEAVGIFQGFDGDPFDDDDGEVDRYAYDEARKLRAEVFPKEAAGAP